MKVGGRRQLTIPPELAYGPAGSGHRLSGKTLVFIIDLLAVQVPPEVPTVEPATGPAPADLVIEDITIGDGDEAQPGGVVDVHYHGVEYDTNDVFDSSFARGDSVRFPLGRLIRAGRKAFRACASVDAASSRCPRSSRTDRPVPGIRSEARRWSS